MYEVGQTIDRRLIVEGSLGEGGLAQVFLVRHKDLRSVHALKVLAWSKPKLIERFVIEGRIQSQLRHPYIVNVTDLVYHEGRVGLLMEYIEGKSLEDRIIAQGAMEFNEAMELFARILCAIETAHLAGIWHRDLKPANILLSISKNGLLPKVADFGIAKVVADVGPMTRQGSAMGTPGYLAPEQVRDASGINQRADLFALGAILHEMLTGRQAFVESDGRVTLASTLEITPPRLDAVVKGCPKSVADAIERVVEHDPELRFNNCDEFAAALFAEYPHLLKIYADGVKHITIMHDEPVDTTNPGFTHPGASADAGAQTGGSVPPTLFDSPTTSSVKKAGPPLLIFAGASLLLLVVFLIGGASVALILAQVNSTAERQSEVAPNPTVEAQEEPTAPVQPKKSVLASEPLVEEPSAEETSTEEPPTGALNTKEPAKDPQPLVEEQTKEEPVQPEVQPVPVEVEEVQPSVEPSAKPDDGVAEVVAPKPMEPEPKVVVFPALTGKWSGTARKVPIVLTFGKMSGGSFTGVLRTQRGPTSATENVKGSVSEAGKLVFSAGNFSYVGTVSGGSISGSYMVSGKTKGWPWSVRKQ